MGIISALLLDGQEAEVEKRFSEYIIDAFHEIDFLADIVTPLLENVTLPVSEMVFVDPLRQGRDSILPFGMKNFVFVSLFLDRFLELGREIQEL
jgi:hypothetical protein